MVPTFPETRELAQDWLRLELSELGLTKTAGDSRPDVTKLVDPGTGRQLFPGAKNVRVLKWKRNSLVGNDFWRAFQHLHPDAAKQHIRERLASEGAGHHTSEVAANDREGCANNLPPQTGEALPGFSPAETTAAIVASGVDEVVNNCLGAANGFAAKFDEDESVTDYMECVGFANMEKDWRHGESGAGAGAGGSTACLLAGMEGGVLPETKKVRKSKHKVCAKNGCGVLLAGASIKHCSRCRLVFYCSRSCQKADWKAHQPRCNATVKKLTAQLERANISGSIRSKASAKGGGLGANGATKEISDDEEECPICYEPLADPLSPCPLQPAHRCCRSCVEQMREHRLPACPLCRTPMQDADELFYVFHQLHLRARRATGRAEGPFLLKQCFDTLCRVLEVDSHHLGAQRQLGIAYDKGEGVKKDHVQAVRLYQQAAVQGQAKAQCDLGNSYAKGEGVKKDHVQAFHWYQQAAVQGNSYAQCNLGSLYDKGEGVKKDHVQARH
jgi:hypothetical protein